MSGLGVGKSRIPVICVDPPSGGPTALNTIADLQNPPAHRIPTRQWGF